MKPVRAHRLRIYQVPIEPISRRFLLFAAAALPAVRSLANAVSSNAMSDDPRSSAQGQVKINATLDGSPAFWSYSGIVYAMLPKSRPIPLLRVTGCQANWAVIQSDGSFRMAAPLLTYFRSIETGEYLDAFENPFSGRRNDVHPNQFGGAARAFYPADGGAMRTAGEIAASQSAPEGFKLAAPAAALGRVEWSLTRDAVVLNTDQFFDVKTQPQGEAQTRTADRARFFDHRVKQLAARFSATTISPWLKWMDLGDKEGHLVWHTSGEKLFSAVDLPADYRARAGGLLEELTTRPDV